MSFVDSKVKSRNKDIFYREKSLIKEKQLVQNIVLILNEMADKNNGDTFYLYRLFRYSLHVKEPPFNYYKGLFKSDHPLHKIRKFNINNIFNIYRQYLYKRKL